MNITLQKGNNPLLPLITAILKNKDIFNIIFSRYVFINMNKITYGLIFIENYNVQSPQNLDVEIIINIIIMSVNILSNKFLLCIILYYSFFYC